MPLECWTGDPPVELGAGWCHHCLEKEQLDVSLEVKITHLSVNFLKWFSFCFLTSNLWRLLRANLPTRPRQHPTLWVQLSEKIWKYSVEWDGYPDYLAFKVPFWIPRVPFLRRLLTHAFYLCQKNNEVECFWPSHSTACPRRVHCHFENPQRASWLLSVPEVLLERL